MDGRVDGQTDGRTDKQIQSPWAEVATWELENLLKAPVCGLVQYWPGTVQNKAPAKPGQGAGESLQPWQEQGVSDWEGLAGPAAFWR